jgi:hypothetical protein
VVVSPSFPLAEEEEGEEEAPTALACFLLQAAQGIGWVALVFLLESSELNLSLPRHYRQKAGQTQLLADPPVPRELDH